LKWLFLVLITPSFIYGVLWILQYTFLERLGSPILTQSFNAIGSLLLGFESALNRDYPVVFGSLFIFTLLGLIIGIISDLMYVLVDPRIDFESRQG
jgi:microcin C transport system permease protein